MPRWRCPKCNSSGPFRFTDTHDNHCTKNGGIFKGGYYVPKIWIELKYDAESNNLSQFDYYIYLRCLNISHDKLWRCYYNGNIAEFICTNDLKSNLRFKKSF